MLMIWGEGEDAGLRAPLLSMNDLPHLLTALGGVCPVPLADEEREVPRSGMTPRRSLSMRGQAGGNPGLSDSEARVFASVPGRTHRAQLECSFIIRVTEAPGFPC